MPSNKLAQKVHRILSRAAPENLHQVPELVTRANEEGIDDDEFLNVLCYRYQVGRDGWPTDPTERRRVKLQRFFKNNDPTQMHKADILFKQQNISELEVMTKLYQTYDKDELGDPIDDDEWLRAKLKQVFKCVAPERVADLGKYVARRKASNVNRHTYLEQVCEDFGVGTDGWPNDPKERKRAKLIRFFLNNAPEDLRKVEQLSSVGMTEQQLFAELYERYGKDEFGNPVKSKQKIREKLTRFLMAAAPDQTESVDALLEYQENGNYTDEEMMQMVQLQFEANEDGWPEDKEKRLQSRIRRFFLTNAPQDMKKADALCKLKGISEDEILKQLYKKYGKNEFGEIVMDQEQTERDALVEFYEQYVDPEDIAQLVEQAMSLRLPQSELLKLLEERYAGIEKKPNPLREKLKLIYRRVAPNSTHQIHYLIDLKRKDSLEDDDIIKTVCEKYECDDEGWPQDELEARRRRLVLFFKHNDVERLIEVETMMTPESIEEHPTKELMKQLCAAYGFDEIGDEWVPEETSTNASKKTGATGDGDRAAEDGLYDTDDESGGHYGSGSLDASRLGVSIDQLERLRDGEATPQSPGGGRYTRPMSGFAPGATQVWPPPNQDTMEALHNTELFKHMIRKYGGSGWSRVASVDINDKFAKLSRHFDDGSTWVEPEGIPAPDYRTKVVTMQQAGGGLSNDGSVMGKLPQGNAPALSSFAMQPQYAPSAMGGAKLDVGKKPGALPRSNEPVFVEYNVPPIRAQNNLAAEMLRDVRHHNAAKANRAANVAVATDVFGNMNPLSKDRIDNPHQQQLERLQARNLSSSSIGNTSTVQSVNAAAASSRYTVLAPAAMEPPKLRTNPTPGHGGIPNPSIKDDADLRKKAASVAHKAILRANDIAETSRTTAMSTVNGHESHRPDNSSHTQVPVDVPLSAVRQGGNPHQQQQAAAMAVAKKPQASGEYLWVEDEQKYDEMFPLPQRHEPQADLEAEGLVLDQRSGKYRPMGLRPQADKGRDMQEQPVVSDMKFDYGVPHSAPHQRLESSSSMMDNSNRLSILKNPSTTSSLPKRATNTSSLVNHHVVEPAPPTPVVARRVRFE